MQSNYFIKQKTQHKDLRWGELNRLNYTNLVLLHGSIEVHRFNVHVKKCQRSSKRQKVILQGGKGKGKEGKEKSERKRGKGKEGKEKRNERESKRGMESKRVMERNGRLALQGYDRFSGS
jgi:hypothetical protein